MIEIFRDALDFLRFYKERHPALFWIESAAIGLILLLILWQIFFPGAAGRRSGKRSGYKGSKKWLSGKLLFLLVALTAALIPAMLRWSGWFSREEEILINTDNGYVFGIDVSHYSGTINWNKVKKSRHPIKFVFIRATMGSNGRDRQFTKNWQQAVSSGYIRGAYHYYRPGEDPALQFRNFARNVKLLSGDFRPVLDIERAGNVPDEKLRAGVKEWLKLAEDKYGVQPIVYTGLSFYKKHFAGHLNEYPLWIAAYDGEHRLGGVKWKLHQFTDKLSVAGIAEYVDGNHFSGSLQDLNLLRLP
jgi:GH25 family lysozyme M1 (1,4-beta-N-acetylmuramidase)